LMLRHHAALVSGKLTRVPSGVNFPPSEVIMSRLLETDIFWFLACFGYMTYQRQR
jgi:hypothetical protein